MLSEHVTIRMDRALRDDLNRRAKESSADVTVLARRYIEEGLLMDRFPGIRFWHRPGGREAMLAGHRISVADVVETFRAHSGDLQAAAEYLNSSAWLANQALDYYAERKEEIDEQVQVKLELAEREHAAWQRRQRVLAG